MILAAPLVIPFAEAIGISIAALGMAKVADKVNEYIQDNPEQSMKILSTIIPGVGIGEIFMNKSKGDEEVSETEVTVESEPRSKKEIVLEGLRKAREGKGNYSSPDAEGPAVSGRGNIIRGLEDAGKVDSDPNYDASKKYQGYKRFLKKADGGAIGIEVLFEEKNPRQGLFMGGSPLDGQALNIYNSMNAYGFDDQAIADALSAQGLYTAGGATPAIPDTTQNVSYGLQTGNDGGGGITALDPLNTRTNIAPSINRNDRSFIDPLNEKIANQMTVQNPNLNKYTTEEIVSMNPDMFDIKTDKGFIGNTIDNFKTMGGSLMNTLSGSKVGQGATTFKNRAFTPMMALMNTRNPLNPGAFNYSPNLQEQMDFLSGQPNMIGQDPSSGLTKYGIGSVLSGQNVVSGFGTNDYEQQLQKKKDYFEKRIAANKKYNKTTYQNTLREIQAEQDRQAARLAEQLAEAQKEIAAKGYKDYGQGGADSPDTSNMDAQGNYDDSEDPGQTE
ncbi:hypothetical protein N9W19_00280 [bacterium]|nr:hypothetical protein [bacterium]